MKKLSIQEFAKVLSENPNKELYVAGYCYEAIENATADNCEAWFAFKITSISDSNVLIANYCGSIDPYSLRVYPIDGYIDDETNELLDLEHALKKYTKEMSDEFQYEGFVLFDNEFAI